MPSVPARRNQDPGDLDWGWIARSVPAGSHHDAPEPDDVSDSAAHM